MIIFPSLWEGLGEGAKRDARQALTPTLSQRERAKRNESLRPMTNVKPKNFETSLEELERIVRELEQGELTLEKSLELFEQGVKLSRECQERLTEAERRIEILMRDNQGRAAIRPFDPESELGAGDEDDDSQ
jgi:exodeoxyribonuclease VII small subunit